jgi:2-polyprenyl-3-methyl-5-hydroxy-6-metoxy-1,4-benzoquinol methylase
MQIQESEWFDRVRQQFDYAPYPRIPLEKLPHGNYEELFVHSLVTPYYLRHQTVVDTRGKTILDVGCGSGYKSLILAIANPGAHIVGIDVSSKSVELSRLRFQVHGFTDAEFHTLSVEELPQLGMQFDYINCDEVLYLLPNPTVGLQIMGSVLKPTGIIRTNLHSYLQRDVFYRAQDLFRMMGLMDGNPEEFEIDIVRETMASLKDDVLLKKQTWAPKFEVSEDPEAVVSEILMNHLFQEDKGYTVPQLFEMLNASKLELITMLDWQSWNVADLFETSDGLPKVWQAILTCGSTAETLPIYELFQPNHRLLDFWCGLPLQTQPLVPIDQWEQSNWQNCTVHLHPQLQVEAIKAQLMQCIDTSTAFDFSRYVNLSAPAPVSIDSHIAIALLPLWDGPQPMQALVERYQTICPLHPITLQPVSIDATFSKIKQLIQQLAQFCYVLIERSLNP